MKFDDDKITALNQDFSIFHPTVDQLKMIYELSEIVSQKIELNSEIVRTVFIRSIVKNQELTKQFHYVNEQNLPQAKVVRSQKVIQMIVEELVDLLQTKNREDILKIEQVLELIFENYVKKYAGRTPSWILFSN